MQLAASAALRRNLRSRVRDRALLKRQAWICADRLLGRFVKQGQDFLMLDGSGQPVGTIPSPVKTPRLGRHEATVYLWRRN